MSGFIITGTDTDVGKTVFAAGLAQALKAAYWKPVQAGLDGPTDSEEVTRLAPAATVLPEAHCFRTPCSPHEAGRIDGIKASDDDLQLPETERVLVVEGAGGLMVPYRHDLLSIDLFKRWELPLIVVARTRLGTINHTLLTLGAARTHGLAVAGVAFVGEAEPVAEEAIVAFGNVAHLGRLPYLDPLDAGMLEAAFRQGIRLDLLA